MADVAIPGRNGYEICEYVKAHPEMRNTPVVLLVPAFEPFDEERARRIGADYHLTKPFQSIRTLISTVKNLIEPETPRLPVAQAPQASQESAPRTDTKSAKIEELIRKSAGSSVDPTEDEPLSEIGLEQSGSVQSASLSGAQPHDEPLIYEPSSVTVIENHRIKMPNESITLDRNVITNEFDDILELDDVLPELSTAEVVSIKPANASIDGDESGQALIIPRSVIDEIVSRVVDQLSVRLTEKLKEIVKNQQLAESG